jgi:hypothetical protein
MEIVGGFMVMMSILGLFLAVVWLIMPFVVFTIKGKQDRTLDVLEAVEKRLVAIEARLQASEAGRHDGEATGDGTALHESSYVKPAEDAVILPEPAGEKNRLEASLTV